MSEVTKILDSFGGSDDRKAAGELLPLVYEELKRLASHRMQNERKDHTLSATALVHEAYLRLVSGDDEESRSPNWDGRAHFFAAAAEAMRRILVDNARRKRSLKRGGDRQKTELADHLAVVASDEEVLLVDEALDELSATDERAARVVKLHYFAGMSMEETASALGIGERSVYRDWSFAKGWLRHRLKDDRDSGE
ncbi:MAG: ECF-type sigma factor [Planctomycetota bacterium]